jgi:ATP-binding cassette subfamily C protein LapB
LSQDPHFPMDDFSPQADQPVVNAAVQEMDADADAGDPLLDALLWLCKHHGQERTASSLLGDVGHETAITPTQAVRVMRDAGFNAAMVKRAPQQILGLLFPVVLLLKQGEACVLVRRLGDGTRGQADERYEVVMPSDGQTIEASAAELMLEYTGYALVVSQKVAAPPADDEVGADPDRHWLWGTLRRFSPYYRSAMMAAMLSNVLMLVTGLFSSVVYDRVIPHKAMVTLWSLALGTFVAIAFDLMARQLRSHLIDLAGKKADLMLGNVLFKQALNLRLVHRPASSGSFAHQLSQIEVVREFSTSATLSALTDLPFVLLFIAMVFVTAGPLGWVLVAAVPLMLGMSWFIQGVLGRLMTANVKQHAELQGVLVEAVEGIEDVRAAGAAGFFLRRYEEANAASAQSSLRARGLSSWVNNASMVSQQLVTVVMLVWGVHLIHDGVLTGGALIGAVMFAGRAIAPLSSVVSLATRYQGAKAALRMLDRIMKLPTDRELNRPYLPQTRLKGKLSLRDVTFSYPMGVHEHAPTVLKEVTLNIQPGQRVAILGKMGSGKSTILRLLGGLYQPTEGMIEVDGIDLRQIDPVDFRSHIGFVSQEPRLFSGTLRDNILMGRAHADPRLLVPVLQLTGLDKVAAAHPLGLDMPVGESGALLSGGQRQLVALARCLVTQPQALLLDEPTSSMDAQAEAAFVKHLGSVVGQRTLVLVTHRPALLDVVDHVVVMEAGRVVASGPKAQVLAALAGKPIPPVAAASGAPAAVAPVTPAVRPAPDVADEMAVPDLSTQMPRASAA